MLTRRFVLALAGAALLALPNAVSAQTRDIVATAQAAGQFNTLLAAADAAGLVPALSASGAITVFAPTDAAFRRLGPGAVERLLRPENRDQLRAILTYHVLPQAVPASAIPTRRTRVATLNRNARVAVLRRGSNVTVDSARVVQADIRASNGIIHVIDRVLIPRSPSGRH